MEIKISEKLTALVAPDEIDEFCAKVGVRRATFLKWRKGETIPSVDKAIKIAEYLGVRLQYLCCE